MHAKVTDDSLPRAYPRRYNTGRLVNRLQPPAVPKGHDKAKVNALSPPPPPSRTGGAPKYAPVLFAISRMHA